MIIYSRIITPPASEPVTVDEAKAHLRVDGTYDDTYITMLIKVARQLCESYSGLSFITQEREINLDSFPCGEIQIPNGPVKSVDDFVYINSDGDATDLVIDDDYVIDLKSDIARITKVDSWPSSKTTSNAVTISYTAGYANDEHDPVPEVIKQAILLTVGTLYENRQNEVPGSMNEINWNSRTLLDTVKVYGNAFS